ncbi:hypothetical protein KUTeg_011115 [Tegillarca granosa]|uniref:Uncharacterized protein n=1 Tax=Tegillarca granosa TaxID=220873 RepID=A0ABQ9F845_TEGGR|nr:hypothetical protein KUTeg_011115 [Tegillarca granosa]
MNFLITLLFIIPLLVNRSCHGSDLDLKKRCICMSFKEKMALLKLQYQILEKQTELQKKDNGKFHPGDMDKFKVALISLTHDVSSLEKDLKKNTKAIKHTQKMVNQLSSKLMGLQGMSSQVRTNTKLLQDLIRHFQQRHLLCMDLSFLTPIVHSNLRAIVTVSNASKTGFTLTLSKWATTKQISSSFETRHISTYQNLEKQIELNKCFPAKKDEFKSVFKKIDLRCIISGNDLKDTQEMFNKLKLLQGISIQLQTNTELQEGAIITGNETYWQDYLNMNHSFTKL